MQGTVFPSVATSGKEIGGSCVSPASHRKERRCLVKTASIEILSVGIPLLSPITGLPLDSVQLEQDRLYTIGRSKSSCDFFFQNRLVSKQHCQVLFDNRLLKIYIIDGAVVSSSFCSSFIADEFRRRVYYGNELEKEREGGECFRVSPSLNGVYVNGFRIRKGMVRELFAGDEVSFLCGSEGVCSLGFRIGFVIQRIIYKEDGVLGSSETKMERPWVIGTVTTSGHSQGTVSSGKGRKRVYALKENDNMSSYLECSRVERSDANKKIRFLLSRCRHILHSDDPISCIRRCALSVCGKECRNDCSFQLHSKVGDLAEVPAEGSLELKSVELRFEKDTQPCDKQASKLQPVLVTCKNESSDALKADGVIAVNNISRDNLCHEGSIGGPHESGDACDHRKTCSPNLLAEGNIPLANCVSEGPTYSFCPSPGEKFYLNRLHFMDQTTSINQNAVSLPELLHPVENLSRIFIATFTSDILWFISCCKIPCHLPVTIACHNTERCWSSSPDRRSSIPYPNFPNLVLVFPPFPETIAFGKDRKKLGIACHHPKLFILQREDSIRVIITSANLGAKQWTSVTNTVWWQDFPRRKTPDYSSLFVKGPDGEIHQGSRSDFAAQLAGFVASLLIDVPSQAHWIAELTKYNFDGATGQLIASVPGIHSYRADHPPQSMHLMPGNQGALWSLDVEYLGSVQASVVGLNHLFRTANDSNGALLKKLASFLCKSRANEYGMLEVALRRNTNVAADVNAVSVLVPNPDGLSAGDCVQLGFLPRNVAKWVSPLWDVGFLRFYGYVNCEEALEVAFEGNNTEVQLTLHVAQGHDFVDTWKMIQPQHVVALCSLIASIQRCTGIWRLQEVLTQYKWPESQETDFIYGASSIGSINTQFLTAFSAAVGKRSVQPTDSEESDPEWGCWSASQELKSPSIRVIFPTIERVKNACDGVLPSRRLICFSEKTWQNLRHMDILRDAVPHPCDRVRHPMHVKVIRRRFESRTDASSCGWVYCGSHNFSAAAWGRPISNGSRIKDKVLFKSNSSPGSRLHVCNYEFGIVFVFPPPEVTDMTNKKRATLDDIVLPFVVPPPKYRPRDRPATKRAMSEALRELAEADSESLVEEEAVEEMMEEIPDDEEEVVDVTDFVAEEKEEEKAYAEMLWSQVESSQSS